VLGLGVCLLGVAVVGCCDFPRCGTIAVVSLAVISSVGSDICLLCRHSLCHLVVALSFTLCRHSLCHLVVALSFTVHMRAACCQAAGTLCSTWYFAIQRPCSAVCRPLSLKQTSGSVFSNLRCQHSTMVHWYMASMLPVDCHSGVLCKAGS
jgi:hypothetical protein